MQPLLWQHTGLGDCRAVSSETRVEHLLLRPPLPSLMEQAGDIFFREEKLRWPLEVRTSPRS